ncbi:flagellar export protein FliJ [Nocardioides exalbidus]|uniref:Flagellar export protein FliJ n=1 Tax=Nocardioides exalbidus TaxID=402596 RepID=A0A1H4N2F4_9ACTN|nr:flagellar FliJ family protein [Nocardioides exalbidus]SEB89471.1 flagellar export protein FliJ [Nocardioides exalbidus]
MARTPDSDPDAGMRAVARVRGVREHDSRLGLASAAADELEAARRLDAAGVRLAAMAHPAVTDPAGFAAARLASADAVAAIAASRASLASFTTFAAVAREHWQRDRARLDAVELLLERRVEQRREERLRRERVEIDDLVAARWLRARRGADADVDSDGGAA